MHKGVPIHITSVEGLREWEILKDVAEEELKQVKALYVFKPRRHVACPGETSAAIYLTASDVAYGLGHNCQNTNFLGLPVADRLVRHPHHVHRPIAIPGLSGQGVKDVSVGGTVCAAVTSTGRLLWWGRCPTVSAPHSPRGSANITFTKAVCGDRMVVALTSMYNVYVWGKVDSTSSMTLEGVQILIEAPIGNVECGLFHAALVDLDGIVYTWSRRGVYGCVATPLAAEKCIDVKCGPRSTFCLTEDRRVITCGILPLMVDVGLSNVKEINVVRSKADNETVVVATPTYERIYTWGGSEPFPMASKGTTFLKEFARLGATPNLLYVYLQPAPTFLSEAHHLSEMRSTPFRPRSGRIVAVRRCPVKDLLIDIERQPHEGRLSVRQRPPGTADVTITSFDILKYLYLRNREDLADQLEEFLRTKPHKEIAKRIPASFDDDVAGRKFIMSKFLSTVESQRLQNANLTISNDN